MSAPVLVEEPIVDRPRVDPDAGQIAPARRGAEPLHHFVEDPQDVPVQTGRELHRVVREAVDLVEGDDVGSDRPDDHPATRCAEIDSSERAGTHLTLTRAVVPSSEKRCGDARINRDVQTGSVREITAGKGEHGVGHVLGEHLTLEQRTLCIERTELLFGHAVDCGALGAPTAGEDAGSPHDPIRVDAVDTDPNARRVRRPTSGPGGPGRLLSRCMRCCSGRQKRCSSMRCR